MEAVVENNKAAEAVVDNTQAVENNVVVETPKAEAAAIEKTLLDYIPENLRGSFQSPDDVISFIETKTKEPSWDSELSDFTKKVINLDKEKKLSKDTLKFMATDYESLSVEDTSSARKLIAESLAIKNPKWTKERINREIDLEYDLSSYDEDERETKEYQRLVNKLTRDAENAKDFILSEQSKLGVGTSMTTQPVNTEEKIAMQAKAKEDFKNYVDNVTKDIKSLVLEVEEGNKIEFTFDDESAKNVRKRILNPEKFLSRFLNADGTPNIQAMYESELRSENFDKILKFTSEQVRSKAIKDYVSKQSNVNINNQVSTNTEGEEYVTLAGGLRIPKDQLTQFRQQFRK